MAKKDLIEAEGVVVDAQPNAVFVVKLESGHQVLAHVSGKIRMNFIRILPGDRVKVALRQLANRRLSLLSRPTVLLPRLISAQCAGSRSAVRSSGRYFPSAQVRNKLMRL